MSIIESTWHKSSYSGNGGNTCVEVAQMPSAVLVRDTEYRSLGHVDFPPGAWSGFLSAVKRGDPVRVVDGVWHTSNYSNDTGGQCVEVAELPDEIFVRDTQNRMLSQLAFGVDEWEAFLRDVKAGRL